MENKRLEIATQMAAALLPRAIDAHWPAHQLAHQAVALADALIEVCGDEPTKPE
jgi:hypothetical protein